MLKFHIRIALKFKCPNWSPEG